MISAHAKNSRDKQKNKNFRGRYTISVIEYISELKHTWNSSTEMYIIDLQRFLVWSAAAAITVQLTLRHDDNKKQDGTVTSCGYAVNILLIRY